MTSRQLVLWIINAALVIGVVGLTALGALQLIVKSDPTPVALADQADLRQAVTDAAAANTVKILSYSPDTIETDLAAGLAVTTGDFADYYKKFTEETVMPAARQKNVTTTATVVQSGVISIDKPDTASALVFVNQVSTSTENPDPSHATSAVRVGLKKDHGQWLISSFDPQ